VGFVMVDAIRVVRRVTVGVFNCYWCFVGICCFG